MMNDNRFKAIPSLNKVAVAATNGTELGAEVDMQDAMDVSFHLVVTEATSLSYIILSLESGSTSDSLAACAAAEVVGGKDGDVFAVITGVGTVALGYSGQDQFVAPLVDVVATDVDYHILAVKTPKFTNTLMSIPGE